MIKNAQKNDQKCTKKTIKNEPKNHQKCTKKR
jgi:hypothetical protein